jgi:2Fe-2S ferredoxin
MIADGRALRKKGAGLTSAPEGCKTPQPMPKITYIDNDGTIRTIDAELGATVMETAINNDVPGILATCGGSCSCATCHVYVSEGWFDRLPPPALDENDMLDTAHDLKPTSRLSCQIKVTAELDGLTVTTPPRQI